MQRTAALLLAMIGLSLTAPALAAVRSTARIPALYRNCKAFNKRYPHGVGRVGANDRTSSGTDPVTTFRRSNRLFRIAMSYNKGLDRDKDKIACEKA